MVSSSHFEILCRSDRVIITDIEAELIVNSLHKSIDIPGVPKMLEKPILQLLVKAFVKQCSLVLPEDVFNKLISGDGGGMYQFEGEVIRQISDQIYIPIISKERQNQVIEVLCKIFFTDNGFVEVRHKIVDRSLRAMNDASYRSKIATQLNSMVNIPLLNESQEQVMAEKLINVCFQTLELFIPSPIRDILKSSQSDELGEIRNNLVDRLNEKVDLPWASEDDEKKAFNFIIDMFLSYYGLDDTAKSPEEIIRDIEYQLKMSAIELEAHQEHSHDKEKQLIAKIASLKEKRKKVLRESRKGWFRLW